MEVLCAYGIINAMPISYRRLGDRNIVNKMKEKAGRTRNNDNNGNSASRRSFQTRWTKMLDEVAGNLVTEERRPETSTIRVT